MGSEENQRILKEIENNGGIAFVVRSIDDVIAALGVEDRFLFSRKPQIKGGTTC
jgi:hypothetical protein